MTLGTNLLLALMWAALIGPFTPANIAVGFVVGYIVLRICSLQAEESSYLRRTRAIGSLALYTVWELVLANLRVAWYTISSLSDLRPGVLAVPITEGLTDGEITLLSSLITLTPGTLTLDIAEDRSALYIHFMHIDDAQAAIDSVREGYERRILEVTR